MYFKGTFDNTDPVYITKIDDASDYSEMALYIGDNGGGSTLSLYNNGTDFVTVRATNDSIHHYFGSDGAAAHATSLAVPTVNATTVNATTLSASGTVYGSTLSSTYLYGTLQTASQTNITSVGTLGSLSVTGTTNLGTTNATTFNGSGSGLTGTGASFTSGYTNHLNSTAGAGTYNWAGQSGQPTWLWGSNNGTDFYVWNPSNFSVNYATSAGSATTASTVTTAAQPNITSVGSSLTVSSIIYTGTMSASGYVYGTIFTGKAVQAEYADLAEMYLADANYIPGTVLDFGGLFEVTTSTSNHSPRIAGVVSTNPSYLMNSTLEGEYPVEVALTGRVPTRVVGPIRKGDRIVSSDIPGVGQAMNREFYEPGSIIGKSLEDYLDTTEGVIEVVVGRI